jgi:hypothetical protein
MRPVPELSHTSDSFLGQSCHLGMGLSLGRASRPLNPSNNSRSYPDKVPPAERLPTGAIYEHVVPNVLSY